MQLTKDDFLKTLTVQTETVQLDTMGGAEIVIRDLTMQEDEDIKKLQAKVRDNEVDGLEVLKQVCKYALVQPQFFTDEELKQLNKKATPVLWEIYLRVQEIGLTEEQRVTFRENLNNQAKELESVEDVEKKKKSGKNLSSN